MFCDEFFVNLDCTNYVKNKCKAKMILNLTNKYGSNHEYNFGHNLTAHIMYFSSSNWLTSLTYAIFPISFVEDWLQSGEEQIDIDSVSNN